MFRVFKPKIDRTLTGDVCEALKLNDLMDVNKFSRELTKNQIKALRDIPKTWHVTPALRSV